MTTSQVISPEMWRKIFTRGVVCSCCGEIVEEESPVKMNGAVMHKVCFERVIGEALF